MAVSPNARDKHPAVPVLAIVLPRSASSSPPPPTSSPEPTTASHVAGKRKVVGGEQNNCLCQINPPTRLSPPAPCPTVETVSVCVSVYKALDPHPPLFTICLPASSSHLCLRPPYET